MNIARADDQTGTSTTITKRMGSCICGCQGKDPWHQAKYVRVLQDVKVETGSTQSVDLGTAHYTKTATVRLPWGKTRVVFVPSFPGSTYGDWMIDRDSMLDAMDATEAAVRQARANGAKETS